jgi:TolB-like protein
MKCRIFIFVILFTSFVAFGQERETVSLNEAINDSMAYLTERLTFGTKVAVLNFTAPLEISNYVTDELIAFLVNDGNLTVVDRSNLELIQKEIDFQLSGEVSDESAQAIGRKLGVQTIISGSLKQFGNIWHMQIKALEVETAKIQVSRTYTIKKNSVLSNFFPKTAGEKIVSGSFNIIFGLGSYLDGDIFGGLTLTAGYIAAAGLFLIEATVLDWDSPAVGIPATIGVAVAGLTLAYGFVRPFIYNSSPQVIAFIDNTRIEIVPAVDTYLGHNNNIDVRLFYTIKF